LDQRIPLAGIAHMCGTVRFGTDPATSALDVHCRAHDGDNLYVVDTGFFPSSSAVNPALTAMANALRVGDHLLDRLGAGSTIDAVLQEAGTASRTGGVGAGGRSRRSPARSATGCWPASPARPR